MIRSFGISDEGREKRVLLNPETLSQTRAVIQASSGGGKSFLLRTIIEKATNQIPCIVIDPEGEYRTIREIRSMVLVGPDGELPLKPGTGGRVARGLLERSCSAIIDLSDMRARDHGAYVADFLAGIMQAPKRLWRPTIVAIDEAHRFCPEGGRDNVAAEYVIDLMSRGRKRGYGGVLVTQRISKIRKDAVAEAANVFIGRTTLDLDIKRAADYLGTTAKFAAFLRSVPPGEWSAFGPALDVDGVVQFIGELPQTKPPEGEYQGGPVTGAQSLSAIAAMILDEEAPATLEDAERTIAELRARLDDLEDAGPSEADLDAARREAHASGRKEGVAAARRAAEDAVREDAEQAWDRFESNFEHGLIAEEEQAEAKQPARTVTRAPSAAPNLSLKVQNPSGRAQDRVLYALAWWARVGVEEPGLAQLAVLAGMSPRSSTIRAARAALRGEGLIEYTDYGTRLTEAGLEAAPSVPDLLSWDEWRDAIRGQLRGSSLDAFNVLLRTGGLDVADLAVKMGKSAKSSTIRAALAHLRKMGLVEQGQPVRLSEIVFPSALPAR